MLDLRALPAIPPGLRDAAQRDILIPFVGAGASRLAGCPGWDAFADGAVRTLMVQGKFSHAQFAQIAHLPPRVKLSIVRQLAKENNVAIDFRTILSPHGCVDPKGKRLYGALSKLGKTFVTTNYDEWLDDDLTLPSPTLSQAVDTGTPPAENRRHPYFQLEDFTAANLGRSGSVIHLHGSVRDPGGKVTLQGARLKLYFVDGCAFVDGGKIGTLDKIIYTLLPREQLTG